MTNTQLTNQLKTRSFTLGGFTVNPQEHTLCLTSATNQSADHSPNQSSNKKSETVKTHQLPTKCIEVLCYLVERYPEVISRQELIDAIWEGNTNVGQKSLTNAIWSLRKVLNQNPEQTQAITTIRKSGYKLELKPHFVYDTPPLVTADKPTTEVSSLDNQSQAAAKSDTTLELTNNQGLSPRATIITRVNLAAALFIGVLVIGALAIAGLFTMQSFTTTSAIENDTEQMLNQPKVLPNISTITNHPGRELYPSTSADGRWLAYIWFRVDLTSELHLIDLQAKDKQTTRLTVSPYRDLKPTWHPNNQELFMIRKDNINKRCQIIKVNRLTKISEPLVDCSFKAHGFLSIDKQGEYLYYTGQSNSVANKQSQIPGRYRISLTNSAEPERVSCLHECAYQDRDLEFSPNMRYSAQVRKYTPDTEDLYIVDEQTQKIKRLTYDYQQLRGLQWLDDNRHLIVSAQIHGQRQGFILDSHTGKRKNINIEGFSYPNVNFHDNSIYYHEWRQTKFISTVKLAQSQHGIYPLLQANHNFYHPHYSQKLDKIAFVSTESGFSEIWIADADGNNREQLTDNKQLVKFPRFSFDGQYIAFLAPQIGNDQNLLKVLNLTNKQMTTISSPFRIHRRPTWHTNNRQLISAIEDDHIHSLQLFDIHSKDKPIEIMANTLYAQMKANGDMIYTADNHGIWIKSGNQHLQLLKPEQLGSIFNWSYFQDHLYFEKASDKSQIISKLNMQTGNIEDIASLAKRTLDIYGTTTFIANTDELLLSKQQFPQVDIKHVQLQH